MNVQYCRGPPLREFVNLEASAISWRIHVHKPSTHVLTPLKLGALREVARDNIYCMYTVTLQHQHYVRAVKISSLKRPRMVSLSDNESIITSPALKFSCCSVAHCCRGAVQ